MELTPLHYTVLFAAAAFASDLAAQERVQIVDATFPGSFDGKEGGLVSRLVDDLTGEPIAGAEVFLVTESETPIAGEFWHDASGISDADGFVRIARPARERGWDLVVMRHPVRGTVATTYAGPVWRIGRTFAVPVRVLDWLGRPAPGAVVGLCGGCGHTPDIVTATANNDGVALMIGIDPRQDIRDLYVQKPGLHFFYDSVRWRPGDAPMEVRCARSVVQTGKVVDHLGKPVAGAFVGGGGRHRGPWARTAADGKFAVVGAEHGECPHTVVLAGGRKFVVGSASRYPVTITIPDLADPEAYEAAIDVPARNAVEEPAVATKVVAVRVASAPSNELAFEVDYPGAGRDDERLAAGHVEIPQAGPFVLKVHDDSTPVWSPREFTFDDARTVGETIDVAWTPDARVLARAVDTNGRPVAVRAGWISSAEIAYRGSGARDDNGPPLLFADGNIALQRREGWSLLEIAADAGNVRPRILWVQVPRPASPQPTVNLGDIVLGGPPQVRVVDAEGRPLANAKVGFQRPGWNEVGSLTGGQLDAGGVWIGPDLHAGDMFEVRVGESDVPTRTVLDGKGPWTITPARGEVVVQLVDATGAPVDGAVTVRDQSEGGRGEVALRGLPSGPTRMFVGAEGRRSAIVDVVVGGAPATVRVELPPR